MSVKFGILFVLGVVLVKSHMVAAKGQGDDYKVTVTKVGDGEKSVVTDADGNVVGVTITTGKGYDIEMPPGRQVCLIRSSEDSDHECFDEGPVTDEIPADIMELCEDREKLILTKRDDCAGNGNGNDNGNGNGQDTRSDLERALDVELRATWGTCCRWTYTVSRPCLSTYCCKKFLGICIKRCCREYGYRRIWTRRCISGYDTSF